MYIMTDKEKQARINKGVKWLANSIFAMADEPARYMKAYDKLNARFYLDQNYSLSDRLKSSKTKDKTIFDVVTSEELEMLLQSQIRLEEMYVGVMEKKRGKESSYFNSQNKKQREIKEIDYGKNYRVSTSFW